MTLPDTLKIGVVTFTVTEGEVYSVEKNGERREKHGRFESLPATIQINARQQADMKVITLWHEAFHALCYTVGIDDESEKIMDALAHGVVQLLRDNPALVEYTVSGENAV